MDKRMILGLFFATLAILVAGFVEKRRLQGYWVQEEDYGSPGNCNFTQIQQKIRKYKSEDFLPIKQTTNFEIFFLIFGENKTGCFI